MEIHPPETKTVEAEERRGASSHKGSFFPHPPPISFFFFMGAVRCGIIIIFGLPSVPRKKEKNFISTAIMARNKS